MSCTNRKEMIMQNYYLFGPNGLLLADDPSVPDDARGEEFVWAEPEWAEKLSLIPEEFRWEAAQGSDWSPSRQFKEWLYRKCF